MRTVCLKLNQILDIKKWQKLQDSMAKVTNLAIITVDYKGIPVTSHSCPHPFCQYVRAHPGLAKYCIQCDSRAGLEAVRMNAPYIYLCHCNIVDLAVPIIIDGLYIGAIMAGQVHLPRDERKFRLEKPVSFPDRSIFKDKQVMEMYSAIPTMAYQEVEAVSNMLLDFCDYVVEEAINKNLLMDILEQLGSPQKMGGITDKFSGYPASSIEFAKQAMSSIIIKSHVDTGDTDRPVCKNQTLKPALDYIYENKGEAVNQTQMAELCHISASYFSRLFSKEIGEGFSSFLAGQKVEWSKRLLEQTELTVAQISDELGFNDPGHFINTFKRRENITPGVYRKYVKKV
ncbi:MAG: PocR ligand-binding domain-containing protein [Peptococcaceae bacterium]|jgi:ligand-binding sensor protein/AraC-like DNA-binding protein|nr:PocR ligand-binding domain-containing protein [Peptococcaceae bacterium]